MCHSANVLSLATEALVQRIGAQNVEGDDKVDTSRVVEAPDSVITNTEESVGWGQASLAQRQPSTVANAHPLR